MVQMASPQKRKASGVYYFRRRVPSDLVDTFGKEVIISLNTKDTATAKRRFNDESVRFDDKMEQARRDGARPFDTLTLRGAEVLAGLWLQDALEADEVQRLTADEVLLIDVEADITAHELVAADVEQINSLPPVRRRAALRAFTVDDVAKVEAVNRLRLDVNGVSVERLAEALLVARVRLEGVLESRCRGDWKQAKTQLESVLAEYPQVPLQSSARLPGASVASAGVEAPRLTKVAAAYIGERGLLVGTRMEVNKSIRRFTALHGDVPASMVNKAMIREWIECLTQLPKRQSARQKKMTFKELLADCAALPPEGRIEVTSINKDVGTLATVLKYAKKKYEFADAWVNPADGMKVERRAGHRRAKRRSFTSEDFRSIFGTPIYTVGTRSRGGAGEAARWLPIIAAYTGARLEEVGQLRVTDIVVKAGIWCFDFNENDKGKRVKNETSIRTVPLHSDLIKHYGFLDYVEGRRSNDGRAYLFPDLKPDVKEKLTGSWGKWFGNHLRKERGKGGCGIDDRLKVFHCFRHTFKTLARAARVPKGIHDDMTGHYSSDAGDYYGERDQAEVQSEWLEKMDFTAIRSVVLHG